MQSIAAVLLAVAFGSELTSWGASAIPLKSFDEQRRQMADDHRRAVQVRAANGDERRLLCRVTAPLPRHSAHALMGILADERAQSSTQRDSLAHARAQSERHTARRSDDGRHFCMRSKRVRSNRMRSTARDDAVFGSDS